MSINKESIRIFFLFHFYLQLFYTIIILDIMYNDTHFHNTYYYFCGDLVTFYLFEFRMFIVYFM